MPSGNRVAQRFSTHNDQSLRSALRIFRFLLATAPFVWAASKTPGPGWYDVSGKRDSRGGAIGKSGRPALYAGSRANASFCFCYVVFFVLLDLMADAMRATHSASHVTSLP